MQNELLDIAKGWQKVSPDCCTSPIQDLIDEINKTQKIPVFHVNTTFEELSQAVQEVIDERETLMQDILDDYLDYCYDPANPLIKAYDS